MKNKELNYSPLLFLASLWAWWISVSFFMYLMFLTKHKKTPIPTFDTIIFQFFWENTNIFLKLLIIIAILWILFFAFKHFQMLFWNLKNFLKYKKTKNFLNLKSSNKEVQLMILPLTFAMSVNVLFIIWAVFIPNLWNIIKYLFPFSLLAFWIIWIFALKIFWEYLTRIIDTKSFDFAENNNFSQMIAIFAFAMIWVWFWASAAMSNTKTSAIIWLIWSIFFITITIFFWIIKIILGFKSILKNWINQENSPTLWIIIPILTLIWISFVRQSHSLEHNLHIQMSSWKFFILTTILFSLQIIFWYIWYKVMKKNNYFNDYINWEKKSFWSYALICPWVALVVFWFFFLHLGLVKTWIIQKFGIIYFFLLIPLIYIQIKTIKIFFKLNKKFRF